MLISSILEISTNVGITGYVFTLSQASFSWRSILQSTVVLSTTEAEYMVMTETMKEAIENHLEGG